MRLIRPAASSSPSPAPSMPQLLETVRRSVAPCSSSAVDQVVRHAAEAETADRDATRRRGCRQPRPPPSRTSCPCTLHFGLPGRRVGRRCSEPSGTIPRSGSYGEASFPGSGGSDGSAAISAVTARTPDRCCDVRSAQRRPSPPAS